jgi:hypothetical protein
MDFSIDCEPPGNRSSAAAKLGEVQEGAALRRLQTAVQSKLPPFPSHFRDFLNRPANHQRRSNPQ